MSCYERQRGTLVLPTAAVAPLKKMLREASNAEHEAVYQLGRRAYEKLKGKKVEGRGFNDDFWSLCESAGINFRDDEQYNAVYYACIRGGKVCAPKREKIEPKRKTNKDTVFQVGSEAWISFKGREVTWEVAENNHSVERAHEQPLAGIFFKFLNGLVWTRGTGGIIKYDNEYSRDEMACPSVSHRFGPLGVRDLPKQMKAVYFDPKTGKAPAPKPLYGYGRRW